MVSNGSWNSRASSNLLVLRFFLRKSAWSEVLPSPPADSDPLSMILRIDFGRWRGYGSAAGLRDIRTRRRNNHPGFRRRALLQENGSAIIPLPHLRRNSTRASPRRNSRSATSSNLGNRCDAHPYHGSILQRDGYKHQDRGKR